jgi:hypothetical protein
MQKKSLKDISRPEKVKLAELVSPGLLATRHRQNPFTEKEIFHLVRGRRRFALVDEGDFLCLYTE